VNTSGALVFLAEFFNQAAGHEILELFVCTQAEHFLATAHRVADFEIGEYALKEIVEAEYLFFRKDITKLVSDMVWKAT
jgi:N-acetylglutamate synthase-like GNAT family acetyltransferase